MRPDVTDVVHGPGVDEVAAARAVSDLLQPRSFDLTSFPNDEHDDQMVIVRRGP